MRDLDLLQGTLDVLVLKTLADGALHGYAIARWIREQSDGTLTVEDRALYVSLHRLEERGLLSARWGASENNRKAKFYALTPAGRKALREKTADFQTYAGAVLRILEPAEA